LPWNVFRHWLRTQCHRNFLNVELVDSFIGHGDGATLTHGDFSDRVWIEDAVIVRKSIAIAYATLQVPGAPEFNWTNVGVKLGDSNVQRDKSLTFRVLDYLDTHAEQPQTSHKWRHQLKAARQARATIAAFLIATIKDEESTIPRINTEYISKGVASLKTEETTELSTRLIRERGNSPEILGQLRYAYFLWLIQRAWDRHGLHTKIVHRYQRTAKDESAFRLLIIGSLDRFDKFRNALNEIFLSASSRRLNNTQAYCLAALDLNISSRSSGSTLVTRLMDTKGFRLVTSGNNIYLEWNNEEDFEVGQAIQRLRISNRTATLLAQIKSAKKSFCTQTSMIPSELGELARILVPSKGDSQTITIGELLTSGCELINQRNSIQFPGTMSAFLSGRVKSASLPWQDWIAFKGTGRTCLPDAYAITASETDDDSSSTELTSRHTNLPLSVKKQKTTLLDGRKNIRELLKVIHEHLNKFIDRGLERTASINERRDLAIELRKDIRRFESLIPPTFYMLSNWAVALFYRKYSNKKRLLAVSSIRRYFDALASKFAALAGTKDLRLMHEDEIVSFYTDVLSIRSKDKSIYVYRRLRDFHRFVENQFGVSAINWGEIAFVAAEELCSPGYMEEKLYQSLLQYIDNDGALGYRVKTCTLALAIFAFRFGLREDEAMGMMRDDWVDQKDYHFVIVRRDTLRGLKTTAARRQVPLVFKLTSLEKKIFVDFRGQWREMSKGVSNAPLFCDPESPTKNVDATPIYSYLNEAIKLISSASHLSIHKLRHSFAARIWDALLIHKNLDDISWRLNDDKSRKRIRKILLGAQDQLATTRRSPWILAALMGHAHPLHAAFSYIHMQSDLAEAIAFVQPTKDWDLPHREIGVDLDTFTPQTPPQSAPKNEERPISLTDVLTVAGMLSDDTPILSIAGSLNLPFRFVKAVDQVFSSVSQKLTFRPREEDSKNKNEPLQPRKSVTQARENGPPPIPRYKAGSTGLLSHILASDRQIVAARLEDLSKSPSIQEEFSKFNIPLENFIGMFGSRRLISMWTQDQFRFVQKFLTALKLDKSSVCLASPPNVNAKVRAYCENSGLVNSSDIGKTSMSLEIYTNIKLDRVSFGDPAIVIIDRLALMLREDSSKLVKNRYQLIVLSVCVYLWCRWQSIVEKVDGLQI
jgi:site-specific recombinase XerD